MLSYACTFAGRDRFDAELTGVAYSDRLAEADSHSANNRRNRLTRMGPGAQAEIVQKLGHGSMKFLDHRREIVAFWPVANRVIVIMHQGANPWLKAMLGRVPIELPPEDFLCRF